MWVVHRCVRVCAVVHRCERVCASVSECEKVWCVGVFRYMWVCIGPGPLNITFGSDMPITFFISEFTTYILLISIRGSNVLGISDPNVMCKGPGPLVCTGMHGYAQVCMG